ncbi:MAG: cation transporter [Planctomycetaceae bacterium]|nr:cation transporter [Planctomycetaceae bacterium]
MVDGSSQPSADADNPAPGTARGSADATIGIDPQASTAPHTEFPAPVENPDHVDAVRQARLSEMQRVAWSGTGVRIAVIAVEGIAVWWWEYAALMTDLVASVIDVASSIAIVFAIRSAARPPDENHPFGHGRIEPLAGLQMGVLLVVAGAALAIRYLFHLAHSEPAGAISPLGWGIPAAAAVALEIVARIVYRTAEREHSTALLAEASHYRIDALTSLIAAVGLGIAAAAPQYGHHVDLLSAVGLAAIMIVLGASAVRENVHQLLDHVPHDVRFEQVRAAALDVSGVLDVEKIRIQHAGPDAHVDIDIEVDPELSVAAAHVIAQHVRTAIQADWPFVREVVVHVEPYYPGDH